MTDIVLRFSEGSAAVRAVNLNYVEFSTEPCTDIILTFDDAGTFITAQLVKRNEEQRSDDQD